MILFKKILSIFLRISISVVMLIFLFHYVDTASLLKILKGIDLPLLVLAFCVFSLNYILCLWRWELLLKAASIKLPLGRVTLSYAGGIFFNLFLPSTVGGDLVRSFDLSSHTKQPGAVVATVILDRVSGFIGLVFLALLGLFFGRSFIVDKTVIVSIGALTAILTAILLVLFNRFLFKKINALLSSGAHSTPGHKRKGIKAFFSKVRELLCQTHQEIHYFRNHRPTMLVSLLLSLLIQAVSPLVFYIIARSMGLEVNILYFLVFLPIIGAITLIPISIGGLGIRDASTVFFFAQAGIAKDMAFAMSLINFFFIFVYASIGGLIYIYGVRRKTQ